MKLMEFGASIFFTDYSITPAELAVAMEERGFDSVWAAEHSHIPVPRRTRADSELGKRYYDVMDPFVTLTAAACATKRLKVATGICLVIQRDTIQTAKLVASLDQVSGGRFLFGIGGGWNQEEIENHGTVFATRMQKMREQIEAMKAIWTDTNPEYHGELVDFGTDTTLAKPGAKAASAGHSRRRLSVGGATRDPLRRRLVSKRRERQSRGIPASLPQDGAGRRARSGLSAGHDRRRARRSRHAEAVPRLGCGAGQCQPDVGSPRRHPADIGQVGWLHPPTARLRRRQGRRNSGTRPAPRAVRPAGVAYFSRRRRSRTSIREVSNDAAPWRGTSGSNPS